jgi:hypothetical protein
MNYEIVHVYGVGEIVVHCSGHTVAISCGINPGENLRPNS